MLRVSEGTGARGAETGQLRVESDTKAQKAAGMLGHEDESRFPQEDQLLLTQPSTTLGRAGDLLAQQQHEKSLVPFNQISFSS